MNLDLEDTPEAGTDFSDITEFEVWDGKNWVGPDHAYILSE